MSITVIPPRKNAIESFTEGFTPYLQMAMKYMLEKHLGAPEEQRAAEKEKLNMISGVSKGEYPITAIPENIRQTIMRGRSVDTAGLSGSPENLQAMQNISPTAQISGIPSFMKRVAPAETPEAAQSRLMSGYAQQQQSINPYKALQAGKLDLWQKAVNGETLSDTEKMLLGVMAKEDPAKMELYNRIFGGGAQPQIQQTQPQQSITGIIRVKQKSSGQTGTIDINEFDPKLYEKI